MAFCTRQFTDGWSWDLYRQATYDDLPDTELVKLQAAPHEVLGEDGVGRLSEYLSQEEHTRAEANKSPAPYGSALQDTGDAPAASLEPPDWLNSGGSTTVANNGGLWCSALHCMLALTTRTCPCRMETVIVNCPETLPRQGRKSRCAELRKRNSPTPPLTDLRVEYSITKADLPPRMAHPLFLCASPGAVALFLSVPDAELPNQDQSGGDPMPPSFSRLLRIPTLVDELWWLLDADILRAEDSRGTSRLRRAGWAAVWSTSQDDLEDIWRTMAPPPGRIAKRWKIASSD